MDTGIKVLTLDCTEDLKFFNIISEFASSHIFGRKIEFTLIHQQEGFVDLVPLIQPHIVVLFSTKTDRDHLSMFSDLRENNPLKPIIFVSPISPNDEKTQLENLKIHLLDMAVFLKDLSSFVNLLKQVYICPY